MEISQASIARKFSGTRGLVNYLINQKVENKQANSKAEKIDKDIVQILKTKIAARLTGPEAL